MMLSHAELIDRLDAWYEAKYGPPDGEPDFIDEPPDEEV